MALQSQPREQSIAYPLFQLRTVKPNEKRNQWLNPYTLAFQISAFRSGISKRNEQKKYNLVWLHPAAADLRGDIF